MEVIQVYVLCALVINCQVLKAEPESLFGSDREKIQAVFDNNAEYIYAP